MARRPLCGLCITDFCPLQLYLCPSADTCPDRVDGPNAQQRKLLASAHPGACGGSKARPCPGDAQVHPGLGGTRARSTSPGPLASPPRRRRRVSPHPSAPRQTRVLLTLPGQGVEWRCLTDPPRHSHVLLLKVLSLITSGGCVAGSLTVVPAPSDKQFMCLRGPHTGPHGAG